MAEVKEIEKREAALITRNANKVEPEVKMKPLVLDPMKKCGCGVMHQIVKKYKMNRDGYWWNCLCGSTLFRKI